MTAVNVAGTTEAQNLIDTNPILYRGYYYDAETGLYYVSGRYYDPEVGRWISPEPNVYAGAFDIGAGVLAYNVYAYCANNPVALTDYNGESVISTLAICVIAGAVIFGTIGGFTGNAYTTNQGLTGKNTLCGVFRLSMCSIAVQVLGHRESTC